MPPYRAYINATGKPQAYTLIHDVKRYIAESRSEEGLVSVLSRQSATAVAVLENEECVKQAWIAFASKTFSPPPAPPSRQSEGRFARPKGASVSPAEELSMPSSEDAPGRYQLMAALSGLGVTFPFAGGTPLLNPRHEVFALDFEPRPGRREFVITVLPAVAAGGGGKASR